MRHDLADRVVAAGLQLVLGVGRAVVQEVLVLAGPQQHAVQQYQAVLVAHDAVLERADAPVGDTVDADVGDEAEGTGPVTRYVTVGLRPVCRQHVSRQDIASCRQPEYSTGTTRHRLIRTNELAS
jgi:hypothetical protein